MANISDPAGQTEMIKGWIRENWVGVAGVIVVVGGFWWFTNKDNKELIINDGLISDVAEMISVLEENTGLSVNDDTEKVKLVDVDGSGGLGIADETGVLADLPGLTNGYKVYEMWLVNDTTGDVVWVGELESAKGGWLGDYPAGVDWEDYEKVVITKEKVLDRKPEIHVLEGEKTI